MFSSEYFTDKKLLLVNVIFIKCVLAFIQNASTTGKVEKLEKSIYIFGNTLQQSSIC